MEEQESHNTKRNMSDSLEAVLVNVENTDPSNFIHIDKNEFKIGRGRSNDEILANISISRQHCIIKRSDVGEWTIQDFSTTGTFVNGNQLAPGEIRTIKINDSIRFGPMSEFLYKLKVHSKSEPLAKKAKMCVPEMDLRDIVMKQKTFEESQQMERDNLAEQMKAKHNEQLELKNELEKLLNEREAANGVKDHLNKQINTLEKNIEEVKMAEMNLEKLNRELSERLDKERQEFETKLNEEKKKLEEALEISRKEKEMLVNNMKEQLEKLKNEQQIECKKLTESLSEEKKTAEKLQSEKVEIEQRLKEMEDALLKIESKANDLQTTLEKQNESAAKVVALGTVAENVEIIDESHLTILDTIDLTNETPTKKAVAPSSTVSANEDVFNKVGDIMDEQLTCSICSELFVTAMTLNCTHTFCQYCINTWMKKKKECPVCRTAITAMNRSLVVDNFIDKMVENLSVDYKKRRTEIVEERREHERAANQPANQTGGKKGRGRGRGGNANTNTNRAGNTSTAATSRTAGNNHIPSRTSGSDPDWNNASGSRGQHRQQHASSGGTTNREQTPASTQGSGNTTQQTNDDDDGSTWSTSTDADGEDTNSLSSSYSSSQTSEDQESHSRNMDNISIDSDGHSTDNSWEGIDYGDEDYWNEPPNEYVEGLPGAPYGGYGTCYCCGSRGHWAPGCPFR
ncbi:E3 ubiquitin-protein ligase RNF8-like isoform X2 [Diprion similis]|uniref:E3 ubiquitin-protein ligase RNF8-like isoform X2 n=1 Tax=Diprion similis TaxID=362088 RepID=UPI001EF7F0C5|nr:E3 ubiquitin-protein ligase RNF8-like isoform X2 [Diprion similis]